MKLFIPQSIFAGIAVYNLDEKILSELQSRPAANIVNDLNNGTCDAAIIPSFDLLRHPDLFVSGKMGISFDGALCNSFLYFLKGKLNLKELFIAGDVTANEIFLSKILFEEMYDIDINITLETKQPDFEKRNYLIVGNSNYDENLFGRGISFAEQLSEFFDYPYVNFVLASKSEDLLKELNAQFEKIDENIEDKLEAILAKLNLSEESKEFIKNNFNQVYLEMTDNETEGLTEMLKFPYYKGMIEEIIELKFI